MTSANTTNPSTCAPLNLVFNRESGADWYVVHFPDGSTEDVPAEDAIEWLRLRHKNKMDLTLVERALDDCWNFGSAEIVILNPRKIKREFSKVDPKI